MTKIKFRFFFNENDLEFDRIHFVVIDLIIIFNLFFLFLGPTNHMNLQRKWAFTRVMRFVKMWRQKLVDLQFRNLICTFVRKSCLMPPQRQTHCTVLPHFSFFFSFFFLVLPNFNQHDLSMLFWLSTYKTLFHWQLLRLSR